MKHTNRPIKSLLSITVGLFFIFIMPLFLKNRVPVGQEEEYKRNEFVKQLIGSYIPGALFLVFGASTFIKKQKEVSNKIFTIAMQGEVSNKILAIAVQGNGFVPSKNVVDELLRDYNPKELHPQAQLRAQRGRWANRDEMASAVLMWTIGFCKFPLVTSSFGSHQEIVECLRYREIETIEGDCLVVELYERKPT